MPIAVGEQFGPKWDWNELIENRADRLCARNDSERRRHHRVHEDRRDVRDALRRYYSALHRADFGGGNGALLGGVFGPGADGDGEGRHAEWPYLRKSYDLKNGKLWPNERPGLGVEVDTSKLQQVGDYHEKYTRFRCPPAGWVVYELVAYYASRSRTY